MDDRIKEAEAALTQPSVDERGGMARQRGAQEVTKAAMRDGRASQHHKRRKREGEEKEDSVEEIS